MRYRGGSDRKISAYAAVLLIALFGAAATALIVYDASQTLLMPGTEGAVLSAINSD